MKSSLAITLATLLIMVGLFHHPVVGHHDDARQLYVQITELGTKDQLVHGLLIALLASLAFSLATMDQRLGQPRGAYAAYSLGCVLLGVAMLLDGFVVPRVASQLSANSHADTSVLIAIGAAIQIFSKAGLIAHSVAMLAWSWAARRTARRLAGAGLIAALPAAAMLSTNLQLAPHTLMAMFAAYAVWYLAAAWIRIAD